MNYLESDKNILFVISITLQITLYTGTGKLTTELFYMWTHPTVSIIVLCRSPSNIFLHF